MPAFEETREPASRNGRCERARLTAEGPSDVGDVFGEPKVGDLDVTVRAEEDVFWLQVAVDDVERVEVVERERDFGGKEFGDGVGEALERAATAGQLREQVGLDQEQSEGSLT